MSYAGHVFDMIARLKYNNAIRREKKGYFKVAKEFRYHLSSKNLSYKTCTHAELQAIRDNVRSHYRALFLKRLMVLSIVVFVLLMVIGYLITVS